ncbi:hypothetical protein POM88_051310 [Heracleum sosnowskyi]|uniref:Uncharacterized protein n=1 Tax=Heracleum sosnowskyi TaxID=360622 RepID=A0AAD8M3A2_9APIA|nr:hypothetical protein POM88_051310 [Heracleum sosnowskyi]
MMNQPRIYLNSSNIHLVLPLFTSRKPHISKFSGSSTAEGGRLSDKLITPVRPTVPKVGRNAVTPQRAAGYVMDPAVSEPIANGTNPIRQPTLLHLSLSLLYFSESSKLIG